MRSWMTVPAADDKRYAEAAACRADVIVIDFTACDPQTIGLMAKDAITILRKQISQAPSIYFKIPPVGNRPSSLSLNMLIALSPNGIFLPVATSGADVQQLDVMISAQEVLAEIPIGSVRIAAVCGDTPEGLLKAGSFARKSDRVSALAWSAGDIVMTFGARRIYDDNGLLIPPLQLARSTTLIAARAAGVMAIDTLSQTESDQQFERECRQARDHGFDAKFAVNADQVRIINSVF